MPWYIGHIKKRLTFIGSHLSHYSRSDNLVSKVLYVVTDAVVLTFCSPQRNCGKVIFSEASVSHSFHGGVSKHALGQTPPSWADTPGSQPPGRHPPPSSGGHCCGRYASYWNAFFLYNTVLFARSSRIPLCDLHRLHNETVKTVAKLQWSLKTGVEFYRCP